ncbi:hypothetical protein [Formosa algae]|uniref:hypothetical protein n=1 Tax=Formosa algae TaxID=225843 RepID=UPI00209BBE3C|nr:hypothetical protein [Formosa algae]
MKLRHLKIPVLRFTLFTVIVVGFSSCSSSDSDSTTDTDTEETDDSVSIDVDATYFYTEGETLTITTVPCSLSDGSSADCYQIVTTSVPADHNMGPWCPDNIDDDAEAGGIWLEDGEVYDVDGAFIKNMATFIMMIIG